MGWPSSLRIWTLRIWTRFFSCIKKASSLRKRGRLGRGFCPFLRRKRGRSKERGEGRGREGKRKGVKAFLLRKRGHLRCRVVSFYVESAGIVRWRGMKMRKRGQNYANSVPFYVVYRISLCVRGRGVAKRQAMCLAVLERTMSSAGIMRNRCSGFSPSMSLTVISAAIFAISIGSCAMVVRPMSFA